MVKYNQTAQQSKTTVRNYEGEKAFTGDKYLNLYLRTATQMVMTDKFYGDKNEQYQEWIGAVRDMAKSDPEFLLRLAAYTRNQMKLRTAPMAILVEALLQNKGNQKVYDMVRKYGWKVIQRADEFAEIIAYYISVKGQIGTGTPKANSLPKTLKTLINNMLLSDKFTEYNIIKNDKNNSSIKLRDVLRITHPHPKDDKTSEFFRKIVKQESFADIADETWEGIISKEGSSTESWTKASTVMPIFATVRNLRNLLDNDVILTEVITKLQNPETVKKSRMLPFRFYQAYNEVKSRNLQLDVALEESIRLATLNNIPHFDGVTAVFVDVSGSMTSNLNNKSKMSYMEIGALFGAVMRKSHKDILLFGFDDQIYPINTNMSDSIFYTMNKILQHNGGATYADKCIKMLIDGGIKVDRILFFSDQQNYSSSYYSTTGATIQQLLQLYRTVINPNTVLYDIDLSGYGTVSFDPNNPKNVIMAGWSERIFDLMQVVDETSKLNIRNVVETLYP